MGVRAVVAGAAAAAGAALLAGAEAGARAPAGSAGQAPPGVQRPDVSKDGYSEVVVVPAGWETVVLAGQVGVREDGSVPADVTEQVEVALARVRQKLEAQGVPASGITKVVTYYVEAPRDGARLGRAWEQTFGGHPPAATLVFVSRLARPEYKFEVDVWAARPPQAPVQPARGEKGRGR